MDDLLTIGRFARLAGLSVGALRHYDELDLLRPAGTDPAAQAVSTDIPIGLAPGKSFDAELAVTAPTAPGSYLLLLDVVTPDGGSLVASGANPTLVRVTILAAARP